VKTAGDSTTMNEAKTRIAGLFVSFFGIFKYRGRARSEVRNARKNG
jgi:hypothetical protein